MDRKDFSYTSSSTGYQIQYKGQNIGGAGTLPRDKPKHWKHARADVQMHKDSAESQIRDILKGNGEKRFMDNIRAIDNMKPSESKAREFLESVKDLNEMMYVVFTGKTKHSAWETKSGANKQITTLKDHGYKNISIKEMDIDYEDGHYFV